MGGYLVPARLGTHAGTGHEWFMVYVLFTCIEDLCIYYIYAPVYMQYRTPMYAVYVHAFCRL